MSLTLLRLIALHCALAAASFAQAPYVVPDQGNWTARWFDPDRGPGSMRVAPDGEVRVPAAENRPAFDVRLRPAASVEPGVRPWPAGKEVFVLADTHGEFEITTELLIRQRVIDEGLSWTFGRGHLVVLGDMFDRGAHQTEIVWLLYKLEAEASAAGGKVHVCLGNHEVMVLAGDLRYLHARYPEEAKALAVGRYSDLWGKDTLLGQWLRTKPAVLKLGRTLFLHGGISTLMNESGLSLEEINGTLRAWLNGEKEKDDPQVALIRGSLGPLWYRGYFPQHRKAGEGLPAEVVATRQRFDVDRIAVGHTVVDRVHLLYGGTVIAVQVYPVRDKTTGAMNMEGAFIDAEGRWHRARIDGGRELLEPNGRISSIQQRMWNSENHGPSERILDSLISTFTR
jgi:hypothetical protein